MDDDTFDFDIEPIGERYVSDALNLLDEVFGPGHTEDWFRWKHGSNPAGDSRGWVAIDSDGILGVRLYMSWKLAVGEEVIRGVRPVDTVTAPRARRRGIFSRLTKASLAYLVESQTADIVFNTPNENSRAGYRRLGWTLLEPILHRVRPARPALRSAELMSGSEVAEAFRGAETRRLIHTARTPAFVRWRYDSRSGHDYRMISLRNGNGPNALIYRISNRRFGRLMVVCEAIGSPRERRALISAGSRRDGALAWIAADGPGSYPIYGGPGLSRGSSILAVNALRPLNTDPNERSSWALTLGDLEDVI